MVVKFFDSTSIVGNIFREVEGGRLQGKLGKTVDLTQAEYNTLLEETGAPVLTNIFGLEVRVDGELVPDPMQLLVAQMEADATAKAAPNLIN